MGILSWFNPVYKIATGIYDLVNEEQARNRIYFNEIYSKHIVRVVEKKSQKTVTIKT